MKKEKMNPPTKLDTFITAAAITFYLTAFIATLYIPPEALFIKISPMWCLMCIARRLETYIVRLRTNTRDRDR
jgi:hypothetical protein